MTSLVIYSKRKCNLKPESQLVSRQHLSCYTETEKTFKIARTEEIHPSEFIYQKLKGNLLSCRSFVFRACV